MTYQIPENLTGLSEEAVKNARIKFGFNRIAANRRKVWYQLLFNTLKEPMLILLIAVAFIYVMVGNVAEALFMLVAIIAVSAISFYQDNRSRKALEALEKLNEPLSTVIRNSTVIKIPTHEIAVGDLCIVEEGKMINADGQIIHSNDFSVNEASLTGESFSVFKSQDTQDKKVYSGTLVVSGLAIFSVEKIGRKTQLGTIGESIEYIKEEPSPLQIQITKFVRAMAIVGIIIFVMVCLYSFFQTRNLIESLLAGLTLAMSVLPEEIPVAFTTFLALGAWKLMREGIIIKRSSVVETLGSTTLICTDKTGTITENSMQLTILYDFNTDRVYDKHEFHERSVSDLIIYAMWSSEPSPFDPMEKTLHQVYEETQAIDLRKEFTMIHEYPLDGKPPMMTHIFKNDAGEKIIAAKGAPEAILNVSDLTEDQKELLRQKTRNFGHQGYRVLGVAKAHFGSTDFPAKQQDFKFELLGLVVFYDPPKPGIQQVFEKIYQAGIKVKVITGDNADTTQAIARQAGIRNTTAPVNGPEPEDYSEKELINVAATTTLFTRMFPEAKLALVKALKNKDEVVAMLGDGVNDAPALKAAHIGVAMGQKELKLPRQQLRWLLPMMIWVNY